MLINDGCQDDHHYEVDDMSYEHFEEMFHFTLNLIEVGLNHGARSDRFVSVLDRVVDHFFILLQL